MLPIAKKKGDVMIWISFAKWNGATDHLEPKTWECKKCGTKYTDLEKGYGTRCWQGHELTEIAIQALHRTSQAMPLSFLLS